MTETAENAKDTPETPATDAPLPLIYNLTGVLLGVALNALTERFRHVAKLPHALRLTIVCLVLAGLLSGVIFLGGATIAQQATVLSDTIKSQLVGIKAFLEKNGIDTSYLDIGNSNAAPAAPTTPATPAATKEHNLPSAGAIASSGGAIFSQTLKLILGAISAVANSGVAARGMGQRTCTCSKKKRSPPMA